jgi:2-polyprenyl-3-methyl-5-hydroxy-6-metoxy-1,4-benzoquinol methylase
MIEHSKCKELKVCLCCKGINLTKILDLNSQPLANSYLKSKNESEESFPLAVNYCNDCTHLQLTHAVNPDLLFKNYLYVSGTTKTLRDYFDSFVGIVSGYLKNATNLSVLDIACNDGSQLDSFKKYGHKTYGIDPADNLYQLSSKNHNVVCDYFSKESISRLTEQKFDVIVAQNVFAHNTYPKLFLEVCKQHLLKNGKVFIQTSQADMVKYGQFDTIYHEHISFFNVKSMVALVKNTGLYLQDVLKTDIHGTSYVFVLSQNIEDDNSVMLIEKDFAQTREVIENFAEMAKSVVVNLKNELEKYKYCVIVGYGAAAKGNTLLNFGEIDLDYIVDDNPLKQGLYTPGRNIKIVSLDELIKLARDKPIVWVPLSWNFFDEIKNRVKQKYAMATVFIKYFPKLHVILETQ